MYYENFLLVEYGGIYNDTDQLILRSLDNLRNYGCTMGMSGDGYFGSALILAQRNSTFIDKWIASYSDYNPDGRGTNSVIRATELAKVHSNSIYVHRHYCAFYPHEKFIFGWNYKWSYTYGFHIYKTERFKRLSQIDFTTIRTLNKTLGAIFRFILFDNKELCS
jgi:hypothetical protein